MTVRSARLRRVVFLALPLALLAACGDGPTSSTRPRLLLAPEGNRLRLYSLGEAPENRVLIPGHGDDASTGRDINGQICVEPGTGRFIAGEDTGQPNPPPGWGLFEISGSDFGDLQARQIGKLETTFQGEPGEEGVPDAADPYGCGFLSDGRLVTTDIGNTTNGPATGQLTIWFPPLDAAEVAHCKLDLEIGTAGGIWVDEQDRVYVASARVQPGVHRYTGPFPTSADAAGGCGRRDATGAPLADEIHRELLLPSDPNIATPSGVVGSGRGTLYVSSVINGVIAEYDQGGRFVRRILEPPAGETLGENTYSTGTPFGIARDTDGTVYYSDLGIVVANGSIGPGRGTGSVRRIRFAGGEPLPPETLASGITFPDGLGVIEAGTRD